MVKGWQWKMKERGEKHKPMLHAYSTEVTSDIVDVRMREGRAWVKTEGVKSLGHADFQPAMGHPSRNKY